MKQVKQKTVNSTTLKLIRKKSPVKGERYVYEIHDGMNNVIEENAGSTKDMAMKDFEKTVSLYKEDQTSNQNNGFLGDPLL
jgi:hypothetical protein